jgi:lactate dehydrogenase-like 2-hydroxyacid dehydrogenase
MKKKLLIITPIFNKEVFLNKAGRFFSIVYKPEISVVSFRQIIKKFDYLFTNPNKTKIFLGQKNLKNCKLKLICTASTGTTHIDKDFLIKKNIKLISITKEKKILKKLTSTSELAMGLTLDAVRNISASSDSVKNNNWNYEPFIGRMMTKLKILVIGYGRLGKMYSKYALAFGSDVYVFDPYVKIKNGKIKVVKKLKSIISIIDVVVIHIHADKSNYNLINNNIFKLMKSDIIIINTSRGEVVDQQMLLNFLKKNLKAKYFADVLSDETNYKKNKLIEYSKKGNQVIITPHIGGMTIEGQNIAYDHALKLLINHVKLTSII